MLVIALCTSSTVPYLSNENTNLEFPENTTAPTLVASKPTVKSPTRSDRNFNCVAQLSDSSAGLLSLILPELSMIRHRSTLASHGPVSGLVGTDNKKQFYTLLSIILTFSFKNKYSNLYKSQVILCKYILKYTQPTYLVLG